MTAQKSGIERPTERQAKLHLISEEPHQPRLNIPFSYTISLKQTVTLFSVSQGFQLGLSKPKNRFLAACKPGSSVLNFYLQCLITRPY